jgi:muramidase (phage lysozyme)
MVDIRKLIDIVESNTIDQRPLTEELSPDALERVNKYRASQGLDPIKSSTTQTPQSAVQQQTNQGNSSSALTDKKGRVISTHSTDMTPQQRALLDTIANYESPSYTTIVGGKKFTDFSAHPNQVGMRTQYGNSNAAGRYQFLGSTWNSTVKDYNKAHPNDPIKDFSPASQDKAALHLAYQDYARRTGRDLHQDLHSDDPRIQASLPKLLRYGLGGSGRNTTWQGFQGARDLGSVYNNALNRNAQYAAAGLAGAAVAQNQNPNQPTSALKQFVDPRNIQGTDKFGTTPSALQKFVDPSTIPGTDKYTAAQINKQANNDYASLSKPYVDAVKSAADSISKAGQDKFDQFSKMVTGQGTSSSNIDDLGKQLNATGQQLQKTVEPYARDIADQMQKVYDKNKGAVGDVVQKATDTAKDVARDVDNNVVPKVTNTLNQLQQQMQPQAPAQQSTSPVTQVYPPSQQASPPEKQQQAEPPAQQAAPPAQQAAPPPVKMNPASVSYDPKNDNARMLQSFNGVVPGIAIKAKELKQITDHPNFQQLPPDIQAHIINSPKNGLDLNKIAPHHELIPQEYKDKLKKDNGITFNPATPVPGPQASNDTGSKPVQTAANDNPKTDDTSKQLALAPAVATPIKTASNDTATTPDSDNLGEELERLLEHYQEFKFIY